MSTKIRFLSLNVGMKSDLAGLITLIQVHKLDIILLQEIRISEEQINQKIRNHGFTGKVSIDAEDSMKPGVAILWRSVLPVKEIITLVSCRAQLAILGSIAIVNIYAPSGSDKKFERGSFFARDLFQAFSTNSASDWIVGGDFNCILKPIDVENGAGFNQKKCPQLLDLVNIKSLIDAFRHFYPTKKEYTFFRTSCAPSRLDRFYLSQELLQRVNSVQHVASLSDHCGVLLEMSFQSFNQYGKRSSHETYWKLNVRILEDEDFDENFISLWSELKLKQTRFSDIADWWDMEVKPAIREFCFQFSKQRNARRNDTKAFWFAYLKVVLKDKNWGEVARVKTILKDMLQEDAFGYVVRSRFKNNVSEEAASLFHANREVKNAKNNNINSLKINDDVISNQEVIEDEVTNFFHALFNGYHDENLVNTGKTFQADNSNLNFFLNDLATLSDSAREGLVKDMTMGELEEIVKDCARNKSPGLDGISYEFYQKTFPIIKEDLLKIYRCQLNRKKLIKSNKEGVTRLAPKVDGVPSVDELRPITLLDCDYKILSKWLVERMKPVLPFVIKSGQLCTVGKKNILFGVNNILSSIFNVKQRKSEACLVTLDFFKAYDRVLLDFVLKVLKRMNFGEKFTDWILMLHDGASTRLILTRLTRAIQLRFSIRQGDPLAMLLYILYVEPLLWTLEKKIYGLRVNSIEQKLEAYCDDVNITTDKLEDFEVIGNVVKSFEKVSGAILSRNRKCKVIGFGNWACKVDWPLDWIKPVKSEKIFGIFICDSYDEMLRLNWDFRFKKFSNTILSWSPRVLDTLQQRVDVIRMFGLSRVYYVASILPVTPNVVKKFESLMGKFIWSKSGRILRIALDEIKNKRLEGGLQLPCLASMADSLLFSQCVRLINSGDKKSLQHLIFWLGDLLGTLLPGLGQMNSAVVIPEHFHHVAEVFADMMVSDALTAGTLKSITNKIVYAEMTSSFPPPKVVMESALDYSLTWSRLHNSVVDAKARDVMYLLIHNKLPVPERLFRIKMKNDPYCQICIGAEISDIEHFFTRCEGIVGSWSMMKNEILRYGNFRNDVDDWKILNLMFPKSKLDKELTWLVSSYVLYVWDSVYVRGAEVRAEQFFGFLKFKYKELQKRSTNIIENLQLFI